MKTITGQAHNEITHICAECKEPQFSFWPRSHKCGSSYMWVCQNCGVQMGIVFSDGGLVSKQEPTGKRCERTLALLRLAIAPEAMFIATGCRWDDFTDDNDKYHYESHTCPTNFIECETIIVKGDTDPHGAFELVRSIITTGPDATGFEAAKLELMELAVGMTTNTP